MDAVKGLDQAIERAVQDLESWSSFFIDEEGDGSYSRELASELRRAWRNHKAWLEKLNKVIDDIQEELDQDVD